MNPSFLELRIENTNRCGYRCQMCPREKQTRSKGVMSLTDFQHLMGLFDNYRGTIHLHGYGEPLLDKTLPKKIAYAAQRHPQATLLFFTTLGVKLKPGYFAQLASAGLTQMVVSCYGFSDADYKRVHGVDKFPLLQHNLRRLQRELASHPAPFQTILKGPSPTMIETLDLKFQLLDFISWLSNMGISYTSETHLHNYGSGRTFNKPPPKGVCSVVWGFRKQLLQVTRDLNVIPCCFDFNADIRFGNLKTHTLQEIFTSPTYLSFIEDHNNNRLAHHPPCATCERDLNPGHTPM